MKRKEGKGESGVVAGMYFAILAWHLKTGMPERFRSWTSVRRGEPVIC